MSSALKLFICVVVVADAGIGFAQSVQQETATAHKAESAAKKKSAGPALWTQFEMNRMDAEGNYLWTTFENWTRGVPGVDLCVEIGDDHSGRALHCVIPPGCDALCQHFELAEHARTQGTTLRLQKGATLTIRESGILSKDRESRIYVDGTLKCQKPKSILRVGGPWGRPESDEPSSCHMLVGSSGVVDAWFVGINTTYRAESAPSSPWGPRFYARSTDSQIIVDGGRLVARQGLRMSTTDGGRPGVLRLTGKATFSSERDSEFGVDVWCGVWEIEGGEVKISVGDIEFWGNKFKDAVNPRIGTRVGPGLAVLRLTGNGVSTIRARKVNIVDAAILDVNSLRVPAGTYQIIDGSEIQGRNLRLADGTDVGKWKVRFDEDQGDLLLTFKP